LQPLGGKAGRKKDRKKGQRGGFFSWRTAGRRSDSGSGILLRTTGSWRGASQKFGARGRKRRGTLAGLRLTGRWRAAAVVFLSVTAVYGIAVGGYIQLSGDYLQSKARSVVASAGLAIEKLTIEGQNRTSDQEIVRALGITSRQSILSFDTAAAQARLQKLPWVRHVQVMRLLPSRLHIVINERTPFAIWQRNGETHLVDADGVVIAPSGKRDYPDLPFIVGAGAARDAKALFDLLSKKPGLNGRVRAAVRVAERRWNLQLDNGVEVRLPEENVAYAIGKIDELDKRHGLLKSDVAAIDLRVPGRVAVRLRKNKAARHDAAAMHPSRLGDRARRDI
jgi:cell division protein FtsQ